MEFKTITCDLFGTEIPLRAKPDPENPGFVKIYSNRARVTSHTWAAILGLEPRPHKKERELDLSPEAVEFLSYLIRSVKKYGPEPFCELILNLEKGE